MKKDPGYKEFIALMAVIISITALSIDMMLPALPQIAADLNVRQANDVQLVVAGVILGTGVGQMFFGPLSDCFGRKPVTLAGMLIFILGCWLSISAGHFKTMLIGRFIQGLGLAGPRTAIVALIRDQYDGREMAQIMSAIMAVFILVPAIAPALGQVVLIKFSWHAVFIVLMIQGLAAAVWFALRQPETLTRENRIPFSGRRIINAFFQVFSNRLSLGYTLAAGFMVGTLLAYLNCAQQIFQEIYLLGRQFPLYMAFLALFVGSASLVNSRVVVRLGMRWVSYRATIMFIIVTGLYLACEVLMDGRPSLWMMMTAFSLSFFCLGLIFGNLNAVAMEPLGHIAGMGAAVIGALTSLISSPVSAVIGHYYDGTTIPLACGFAGLGVLSLLVMIWADRR